MAVSGLLPLSFSRNYKAEALDMEMSEKTALWGIVGENSSVSVLSVILQEENNKNKRGESHRRVACVSCSASRNPYFSCLV